MHWEKGTHIKAKEEERRKKMNPSCLAGCLDVETPVKVSFMKLYQWPEADAEFLRMLSSTKSMCHDNYVSRQRYLRSYTFSRKESFPDRTKKWFKEKQKMKKNKPTDMSVNGSCSFLNAVFNFMFRCVAKVDVHEEEPAGLTRKTSAQTSFFSRVGNRWIYIYH